MEPHNVNNVLFTADQIHTRIHEMISEIAQTTESDNLLMIGILRGSFMFFADLVRHCNSHDLHPRIDFMTLESYGSGTESSGCVRITKDTHVDVSGADVILVDDILDSGRTLQFAVRHMQNKGARSVRTCTLLDKPDRRVAEITSDFNGFTVDDLFVVGYGLDYDSRYRELPYIAEVSFS